jgi:ribonuclease P protein component
VLPRQYRLGTAADFAAVMKAGRRGGTSRLVIHAAVSGQQSVPRAGFVVSKKVGNSVVRHRVTRRLRPLVLEQLRGLAPGVTLVVRALPSAATASSAELSVDLRAGLSSAVRKARLQSKSSMAAAPPAATIAKSTAASEGGAT